VIRFNEDNRPHFVTTATLNRIGAFAEAVTASMFFESLLQARNRYGFLVLSFVVMPDHVHAVIVPRTGDTISQTMRLIKGTFSRRSNLERARIGAFWQPSFYDRLIRDEEAMEAIVAYIEENPVVEGLADHASEYAFSSASGLYELDMELYMGGAPEIDRSG